jgi:hypothetical protein
MNGVLLRARRDSFVVEHASAAEGRHAFVERKPRYGQ